MDVVYPSSNEELYWSSTGLVTIKHQAEDNYETIVMNGLGNEEDNFTEDYQIAIKEESQENEQDPLSTNPEYSNSEDDMVCGFVETRIVEDLVIKNEPEEESNSNIEMVIVNHKDNNADGRSHEVLQIAKLFIMWKDLYPEVDEQEQRNIYQETEGNVLQSMERMRILNASRKTKKFISQQLGQQNNKQHYSLDQNEPLLSVYPHHFGHTSPIAQHQLESLPPKSSSPKPTLVPKHHQSGPMPPMQLPHEKIPTPKCIDEGSPGIITESCFSLTSASKKKKPMTPAERKRRSRAKQCLTPASEKKKSMTPTERKRRSRANQSIEAKKQERERNRKTFPCVQCGERFIRKTIMLKHSQKHQISFDSTSQPCSEAAGLIKESDTVLNGTCWSTTKVAKENYMRHMSKQPVIPDRKLQKSKIILKESPEEALIKSESVEESNLNFGGSGLNNNKDDDNSPSEAEAFFCVQCGERFISKSNMVKHFQKHQISSDSTSQPKQKIYFDNTSQPCSQASGLSKESNTVLNGTWWSTTEAAKINYKRHMSKHPVIPERKLQNSIIILKEYAEEALVKSESVEESNPNIGGRGVNNNEDDDNSPPEAEAKTNKYLKMWKLLYTEVDLQEQMYIYQDNKCNIRQTMDELRFLNEQRLRKKYPNKNTNNHRMKIT